MDLFEVTNSQSHLDIFLDSAQEVILFLTKFHNQAPIALHFVDKEKITNLHKQFFNNPYPTDCITIPYRDPNFLGEIFVCPEVASEYVTEKGGSLEEELTLYVIHGFLHLLGYNDIEPHDIKQMRNEENFHLTELAKNNLRIRIRL